MYICGVWVLNIHTGETVAFLRFDSGVQEIFAVEIMAHARFPEVFEGTEDELNTAYALPDEALQHIV
ncbi:DUF4915 domain-containing protein [Leptothoe spongobia]|uniref:DUF4915 domain-containing protein n=1 Tax=Leptothoe spongobia TAU-MAC 1115 TaxID=1967444 RepID=A0A947DBR2_9CYAN|nr:DUF4915 domain-containing protein [Leptothoe spongobia]MBT9314013.1 DUF4915 domain-containing protein [Leptothoe spongobia TAU-MAC 1115]